MTTILQELYAAALLILLVMSAAGWGKLALLLLARLKDRDQPSDFPPAGPEKWFLSVTLGTGIVSWLVLLLGVAQLFYPAAMWAVLMAGVALHAGIWIHSRRMRRPRQDCGQGEEKRAGQMEMLRDKLSTTEGILSLILILLALGSLVYTLLAHALLPPHEWDEIAYHMALAKLYVDAGGIIPVPFIVHSNWPMNTEMVFSLGLLLGSDLMAHLFTWWMSLWTAGGVYLLGKRFFERRIGLLASVLYLTTPLLSRLVGTGLIDVSLTYYGTGAILAYAHYRRNRSLAWIGLSGLFAGMAAGSKLMGGAYPLILGFLIVVNALKSPRLDWRSLAKRVAVFGGLGFLMVGVWYLRSYAFTGNPIWPFLYKVFGGAYWDALGDEYHMESLLKIWTLDLPLSPRGFLASFYYVFFEPARLGGYAKGLGQLTLGLVALSALWLLAPRRIPRLGYGLLGAAGLYYVLWFVLVSPQVRFLLVVLPILVTLAALSFYFLWDLFPSRIWRWVLAAVLVFLLAREYPWFDPLDRDLVQSRMPYVTGQRPQEEFLDSRIEVMPAFRYINSQLAPEAKVLLLPYESRGYYLDRAYMWGHPISQRVIPFEQYDTAKELAEDLERMGVTHILENPEWLYTGLRHWEHDRALMLALEGECGRPIAQWGEIVLYELVECQE
jgi:4-amino-4-deoxy-L-arabinose transferase-like glycosyltransferase